MNEDYAFNYQNAMNLQLEEKYSDSRQRAALKSINRYPSKSVLEIGCARNPLSNYMDLMSDELTKLVIIEPNKIFFNEIRTANTTPQIHTSYNLSLDEYVDYSLEIGVKHDFIVINCLLQEIDNPSTFLAQVKKILDVDGLVWVSVPNADSVHRICANNEIEFQRASFGRKWNFDIEALRLLIGKAGGVIQFQQTRILKPMNDAMILRMLHSVPDFSEIFNEWFNFNSTKERFGAEIDLLFKFS